MPHTVTKVGEMVKYHERLKNICHLVTLLEGHGHRVMYKRSKKVFEPILK